MKAMILEHYAPVDESPLVLRDVPRPKPGRGEVLVRVETCGACHTDLHLVEKELADHGLPRIPGHQVVGRVEELGPGVTRFKKGDRVGVAWLHHTCGQCRFCTTGRENLCESAKFTGWDEDGGYAEYVKSFADFTYPVSEKLTAEQAAPLLCAGIIGWRSLKLSGLKPGQRFGIYGFGAAGHIAIQIARYWKCPVYVVTRGEEHRELARSMGAAWAGDSGEMPPDKIDSAVVFAPAGELVPEVLAALDRGGTCALGGIHMSPVPELDYDRLLYYEHTIRSVTANTRQDGEEFLKLAAEIPIRTSVTVFDLAEANEVLHRIKYSEVAGACVLKIT
jgi:propanol-preferring alcohol dehydrogenase